MSEAPRILIVSLSDWIGIARLPRALKGAGFGVAALADDGTYLSRTGYLDRRYSYRTTRGNPGFDGSLAAAASDWRPSLVIGADEPTVTRLRQLASHPSGGSPASVPDDVMSTIRFSLGAKRLHRVRYHREALVKAVRARKVRAPAQRTVTTPEMARSFAERNGYPVVLKAEFSASGTGVRIADTPAALERDFAALKGPRAPHLIVQQYIEGKTAMRTVVSLAGKVLAGHNVSKTVVHPTPLGPSTIVEPLASPEMEAAARKVILDFGHTGFSSFDFIVQPADGAAYMIEFNPRPNTVIHLGPRWGADLCAALYAALTGGTYTPPPHPIPGPVALFPQEWVRDPHSSYLDEAHRDIPWDDPDLLDAYVEGLGLERPA